MGTLEYEVELEHRKIDGYFANFIIENLYSQLNSKGHQTLVMSENVDHQRYIISVTKDDGFTGNHSNTTKNTTQGWQVLIEWKDKTTTWVDIKYAKEAIPIDMYEYEMENLIDGNP